MSSADESVAAEPSVEETATVEASVETETEPRDAEAPDRPAGHVLPPQPFKYAYFATIGVGVALLTLGAFSSLATVLVYVGVAFFLAVALDPLISRAIARGMSRGLAVGLTSLASVVLIVGVILLVIPALNEQIGIVARNAIAFAQSVPDQPWFQWVNENLGGVINLDNMTQTVLGYISDPNQLVGLAGGIFAVGSGIVDGITGVTIVTILTIYFTASLPSVKHAGYRLVARSRRTRFVQISEEIFQSTGKYVSRQIMLAGVNAAFTFVLSWLAGSPAPALLAAIAFVGALIPVVGTVIAAIIAVLLTLLVNPVGALIIGIVMLIYMQFEAYVLSPRVMSKAVSVPGSVVIVAAVAGAALAGILGALVAVPVAAAIMIILERVVYPQQERA